MTARTAEEQRLYMAAHPEQRDRQNKYLREWRKNNPDYQPNYDSKNRPRIRHQSRIRSLAKYGLTLEQYDEMLEDQNGACAICQEVPTTTLHIDHDHKCCPDKMRSCGACVRGLLCASCNLAIGKFKDDPNTLYRAARYLS